MKRASSAAAIRLCLTDERQRIFPRWIRRRIVFSESAVRFAQSRTVNSNFVGDTGTKGRWAVKLPPEAAFGTPDVVGAAAIGATWFPKPPVPACPIFVVVSEFYTIKSSISNDGASVAMYIDSDFCKCLMLWLIRTDKN